MKKKLAFTSLMAALIALPSQAEITFNGFASIVAGTTTSSNDNLYGYDDTIDFKEGSIFALQASSDLGEGLGVTIQLASKGADDWDPEFKWAFLSYDATDELRILAGRQRAPFYMYSDFLDVSYAYPWISPPKGVYDLVFDTYDGLSAIYSTSFGEVDASFHGIYGRITDEFTGFGDTITPDVSDLTGLATTFTYDWLTLRASYFIADTTMPFSDLEGLAQGWSQAGFEDVANNTTISEDSSSFLELGFQINYDAIIVVGEYTNLEIDNSPLAEEESYYVMAGYQFDSVLVHITYGVDENTSDIYTSDIPYGLHPDIDFLKGTTEGFLMGQETEEEYVTVGVRYDFHDSAAIKLEYTDFSNKLNNNNDAGLLRAALVTVF
ncbi:porin [Litorilituus lipolyticus]|uniref:Porin n=1 Tax=Litorilituus lipolyticus TaxID=2491017 RepID=A0A502KM22_9GAMM|nr:porin [Litorilituus lipolyticus]TPH12506.1 porin [Litorilituus lipolyticus]